MGREQREGESSGLLPSMSLRIGLSALFGGGRDSPSLTVPGHPHLLLCAEEEEGEVR